MAEAWKATWAVSIDGRDISSRLNPYLMSIEISDKDGSTSDTCAFVLDDTTAQIWLPRDGGLVAVALEGIDVFKGTIDGIQSTGARGQGRIITVNARGFDSRGKVKSPLDFHMDNVDLQTFLNSAAKRAGLSGIVVDPAFGAIVRDYWSADSESFLHLTERLSREFGATFKVQGDQAVFARRGSGLTPSGKPLPSMTATYGDNLIAWDISPFVGRPRGKKAKVRYLDRAAGAHKEVEVEIDSSAEESTVMAVNTAADQEAATTAAGGRKNDSQRKSGEGSVKVDLMPGARVEGSLAIRRARPGIDGAYRISGITHRLDRSGGSETDLELKQPGTGTGKDTRTPTFDWEKHKQQVATDRAIANAPAPGQPGSIQPI